jgi:DNA (cytosine-5)-methyltransferase 1
LIVPHIMPTLDQRAGRSGANSFATSGGLIPVGTLCVATGQAGAEICAEMAPTLNCNHEAPYAMYQTAHTLRGEGFDASKDGTGRGTPLVPVGIFQDSEFGVKQYDSAGTLRAGRIPEHQMVIQPVPFDTTQITSKANYSNPKAGDPCHPLAAQAHVPCIAFPERMSGTQCASTENLAPSMGALNPTAVAHSVRLANTSSNEWCIQEEVTHTLDSTQGPASHHAMAVRRLTPRECERLQGFPDDYTAVPNRGKPAADGPRYKALGNSWAVPNVRWIGERIEAVMECAP